MPCFRSIRCSIDDPPASVAVGVASLESVLEESAQPAAPARPVAAVARNGRRFTLVGVVDV